MKTIFILLLFGGLALVGSAFFGVYTAPGLDIIPTVESLGVERRANQSEQAQKVYQGGAPPSGGPFRANTGGATAERNRYLQQQQGIIAPGSKKR